MSREYKHHLPSQSMDMQFSRPEAEKSQCPTCSFREPDVTHIRSDGSQLVITGWDKYFCAQYEDKPIGVVFGDALCKLYEKG